MSPRSRLTCIDLLCNLLHSQFAIGHVLAVELNAQEPWRNAGDVKVGHLVINVYPLLVLLHHSVLGVRVVVDSSVGRHLFTKGEIL